MSNSFMFNEFLQLIFAKVFGIISPEPLDIHLELSFSRLLKIFKNFGFLSFMSHQV